MNKCTTEHKVCNNSGPVVYPTRLLHVRALDAKPDCIRLVLTADEAIAEPYATLSHSWGKLELLKLRHSNLSQCLRDISFRDLCTTFKEAIEVVRRLRVRYLWIDSLCIIQGSDDWLTEAGHMEEYYSNAFLNIAATASKDGSQGLFRERDLDVVRHKPLDITEACFPSSERLHGR